ncbi:hypothetical protein [Algoriphagus sp.]|uniref:hypothetical protein n=1 Tax=Algoriphagus sp. TaxID=1872435 RepID=UPI00391D2DA6
MKKLLFQIGLFIIPFVIILSILDFFITKGLQKTKYGDYKEWNDIYSGNMSPDIVINGSSRAWVHVSPKIIDSILNVNSYNLGIDGYSFNMQYGKYSEYLQYNKEPKLVIQTLDITTLSKRDDLFNYEQFFPYIFNPAIKKLTKNFIGFSFFDYNLPFYRYRNFTEIIKIGLQEYFVPMNLDNSKYKGYLGMDLNWDNSFDDYKEKNPEGVEIEIDSETIELMDTFLSKCKNDNIEVIFVFTPEYIESQHLIINREEIFDLYYDFANKYELPFFDYSKDTLSYQKKYFYNSQHLNKEGSEIFTEKMTNDIKSLLKTH